jgi:acyl carrier protein
MATVDTDALFKQMQELIADKLGKDKGEISLESNFRDDLGADSLDLYEMVYAIEEELGVSIPDDKMNEINTVKDAYDFIIAVKSK